MARVLYLEDDPLAGEAVRQMLASAGHLCGIVASPRLALEILLYKTPDMLIVDMALPEMSGDRVVEAVRLLPGIHLTPILVLTASADEKVHANAMLAGANGVLTKQATEAEFMSDFERIFSANTFRRKKRDVPAIS